MKVKALVAFVGAYDMHSGDVAELPDNIAADLINNGLAEAFADTRPAEKAVTADEGITDNTKRRKKRTAD